VVTNRNQGRGDHYFQFWSDDKRFFLSIEGTGVDIKQYQSGKLTRDQFVAKLKVVESEVDSERSQDLELITTIFARLYEPDLSKTYFTESNVYYERLKDYGAIFYMQVFSSNEMNRGYYNMPTQKMERVTEVERNKKVTELYPVFEKELKENILEYGRTVKSLKPEESLVFNVKITKCKQCGIPSSIEVITKASVLSDYLSGKLDKNAALAKMEVRKGPLQ
jgi:predicted Zn-ribbon and HTH transcriptional regulator